MEDDWWRVRDCKRNYSNEKNLPSWGGKGRRRRSSNDKKEERVRRAIKKAARGKDSSTVRGNIEKRDFRVTRTTGMSETKF